ncbi:MAG TPA: ATP-binding protein [Polyangia bacterium]|nr:ATP-binding protein [Polyangia bacterium]
MADRGFIDPALAGLPQWQALAVAPLASAASTAGRLVFASRAFLDLVRWSPEQLTERSWLEVLFPEPHEREAALREVLPLYDSGGVLRHRIEAACGDGRRRVLDLTTTAITLPDGGRGLMAIAVDSSGQSMPVGGGERSVEALVDDAPDVVLRVDAMTGRILFINRAIERLTGYSPEELYRDPNLFASLILPEQRPAWEACFSRLQEMSARTFDLMLTAKSGERVLLELSLYPVRDAAGRINVLEGVARDNTSLKQLEEIRQRNLERASLDRLKTQLLANVSHELRTPLVSIKGYNDLLLRGTLGPINARQRRGLEIAAANTQRLVELIETLLDLARREEGRLELSMTRFDLREAVASAAAAVGERLASRNLPLRLDLGNEALPVTGDRARLEQVFRALVGNAEKFTEQPGGSIDVHADRRGSFVEVSVADRGIGIPIDARARIFERFYQVDASSTRRFGGAGLGLALAKELVTLHGGDITLDSAEGRGSTFTVRLPAADVGEATSTIPAGRALILVGAEAGSRATIEPLLAASSLQPLDVLWAASAEELLRRARRHRPDIVVLALPDGDSSPATTTIVSTLEELRRDDDTAQLPVVVVADVRGPIGRADLVVSPSDGARLTEGLGKLLGRAARKPEGRARVVVVEDELEILDFTRFVLEREGYDVVSVTSGADALDTVDDDVDLVILDIVLADADGIEICRELKTRESSARVPVLMVTAMTGESVERNSIAAGADGYLVKPFGLDEFLQKVRLHLRTDRARPELAKRAQ